MHSALPAAPALAHAAEPGCQLCPHGLQVWEAEVEETDRGVLHSTQRVLNALGSKRHKRIALVGANKACSVFLRPPSRLEGPCFV